MKKENQSSLCWIENYSRTIEYNFYCMVLITWKNGIVKLARDKAIGHDLQARTVRI